MTNRSIRRALAAVVVAAAALVPLASPATAASPSCTYSRPGPGETRTSSSVTIEGTCVMNSGRVVGDLRLSLSGPNTALSTTRSATGGPAAGFVWTVDLPYNGAYTVMVTATGEDPAPDSNGAEQSTAALAFNVEAPPATPTSVAAQVNTNRTVSLSWKANSEPDLVGYQVQRATGSASDYTALANPKTASYTDESTTGAGQSYKYRILAVRQGSRSGRGVASSPSAVVSATVEDPPTPTTAPPAGSGGSASDSASGSGGTGSTGAGTSGTGSSPTASPGSAPARTGGGTISGSGGGVDLSGFTRLLDSTSRSPAPVTPELDTGYSEVLPFAPPTTLEQEPGGLGEVAQPGLIDRPIDLEDNQSAWRFLAGGLMATVLAMVLMVIKGQVDLADRLDPLPVDDLAV